MARRSVLLVVALIIALVGTAMIVLYVRGIDARATEGQKLVEVLVATEVIDAGQSVASALDGGKFEKKQVRLDDEVDGALSSTTAIQDLVALSTIYPGEQVIATRFGSLGDSENLVIPDNKIAISVELTDPERVAGFVNPGSEIAIFASIDPVVIEGEVSRQLPTYTQLLLPRVLVVGVGTTTVSARTTTTDDGDAVTEEVPRTILTVAVDQKEAERVIYANRNGDVTFALLSKESSVKVGPGSRGNDVMPEAFRG